MLGIKIKEFIGILHNLHNSPFLRSRPGKPSPPSGRLRVRRSGESGSAVTLDWSAPLEDGGSRITSYVVEYRDADSIAWQRAALVDGLTTTVTVRGLRDSGDILFRVYAINEFGSGYPLETDSSVISSRRFSVTRYTLTGECPDAIFSQLLKIDVDVARVQELVVFIQ